MVGHLKNINIGELSLTKGLGANKKKYAFIKNDSPIEPKCIVKIIKADLSVTIKSDGTAKGTKIRVNGKRIEGLKDFNFGLYDYEEVKTEEGFGPGGAAVKDIGYISCSYTLKGKERNGFKVSNTYYLMKSDMEVKEEMKVKELLKQYFGEDVDLKKEESGAIEKSLEVINEYKESFPEELKNSVGVMMKTALLEVETETSEESEDEPEEKTDVEKKESDKKDKKITKVSDDKISKIVKHVVEALASEEGGEEKKEVVEKEVDKKLKEMKETITKKDDELEKLEERLAKVEKVKGVKKSIDGQEEEAEVKKGGKWGSFFIKK